jgi:hypothetical protein
MACSEGGAARTAAPPPPPAAHRCRAGASGPPPRSPAPPHPRWRPSEGITRRAGSREPPCEPNFREPGSHGAREVPRPPVRLRALANGRVREAVLAPDPAPGDKSDRLRGVGQALIDLARTRARGANHGAAARSLRCPKADKIKPAWQSHGGPGTPWPGHAQVYISRDDGWKKSTNTSSYSSWPREVGER